MHEKPHSRQAQQEKTLNSAEFSSEMKGTLAFVLLFLLAIQGLSKRAEKVEKLLQRWRRLVSYGCEKVHLLIQDFVYGTVQRESYF